MYRGFEGRGLVERLKTRCGGRGGKGANFGVFLKSKQSRKHNAGGEILKYILNKRSQYNTAENIMQKVKYITITTVKM